eukprot:GHVS01022027.1.p1 GENE.GHVS01022027.1~~GHVS01022027.1.p1  ORF type:complete len:100 (-),score=1.34 GHVS01022027.1:771-1070(-)
MFCMTSVHFVRRADKGRSIPKLVDWPHSGGKRSPFQAKHTFILSKQVVVVAVKNTLLIYFYIFEASSSSSTNTLLINFFHRKGLRFVLPLTIYRYSNPH